METRDNQVVSQMIEEGLKQRQAAEDKARPVGALRFTVTRWPEGIWEGSYETFEDALRRKGQLRERFYKTKITIEGWKWNGEKWEEV